MDAAAITRRQRVPLRPPVDPHTVEEARLLTVQGRTARGLVAWYALFQLVHFFFNGFYLLNPGEPPFHPPPEGWHPQTVAFINGMAFVDWVNSALTLLFAWGFFRRRPWAAWLGTLTLTVSMYAAVLFIWGAEASGAQGLGIPYLWVNLPFLPVVVLFAAWCYWGATGRLCEIGALQHDPAPERGRPLRASEVAAGRAEPRR